LQNIWTHFWKVIPRERIRFIRLGKNTK
jgi:hypothetical protein